MLNSFRLVICTVAYLVSNKSISVFMPQVTMCIHAASMLTLVSHFEYMQDGRMDGHATNALPLSTRLLDTASIIV